MEMSTSIMSSLAAAIGPTILYVMVVWSLDRYEKEPIWLASVAFLWGALPAVIISFVMEYALEVPGQGTGQVLADLIEAGLAAPIIEEGAKALVLLGIYAFASREFDDPLDGIVYGALVGFGFGMTENAIYFISNAMEGSPVDQQLLVLMRSVVFGLNHAFFTSLTGVSLGYARLNRTRWKRRLIFIAGFSSAVLFHVIHNTFASLAEYVCLSLGVSVLSQIGGLLVLVVIVFLAWAREKEWLERQLVEEVEAGLITREQYEIVGSYRQRIQTRWRALRQSGWGSYGRWGRMFKLATELAFVKERRETRGGERGIDGRISRLKEEIRGLASQLGALPRADGNS